MAVAKSLAPVGQLLTLPRKAIDRLRKCAFILVEA